MAAARRQATEDAAAKADMDIACKMKNRAGKSRTADRTRVRRKAEGGRIVTQKRRRIIEKWSYLW